MCYYVNRVVYFLSRRSKKVTFNAFIAPSTLGDDGEVVCHYICCNCLTVCLSARLSACLSLLLRLCVCSAVCLPTLRLTLCALCFAFVFFVGLTQAKLCSDIRYLQANVATLALFWPAMRKRKS